MSTPSRAGLASAVSLAFTATEALAANPTVSVNGHAATLQSRSGNNYAYAYTIQATDSNGAAAISFSGTDLAGNSGTTTNTTALTVDRLAPTAQISLANGSPTGADTVAVSVVFSESVAPTFVKNVISLAGTLQGAVTVTGADPVYVVSIALTNPDQDGTVAIQIGSGVKDPYGNPYAGGVSPTCTIFNWLGFTAQPQAARLYVGDAYAASVTAHCASPTLTYQWKWRSATDSIVRNIGGNSPNLAIAGLTLSARGAYWCEVAYDGLIHASATAELAVEPRISITSPPLANTLSIGRSQTFAVLATGGYQPLRYQWRKDGIDIPSETNATYTLPALSPSDSATYTVIIRDANTDQKESAGARLTVVASTPSTGPIALVAMAVILLAAALHRLRPQ